MPIRNAELYDALVKTRTELFRLGELQTLIRPNDRKLMDLISAAQSGVYQIKNHLMMSDAESRPSSG